MSDDKTKAEQPPLSEEGLEEIISEHQKWLDSDCKEGSQANFSDLDLTEKSIIDVDLSQADFEKANLHKADLSGCKLHKTIFNNANLQNMNFSNTELQKASFKEANITNSKFIRAELNNTNFKSAILKNSDLASAKLHGAKFYKANMQNVALNGVKALNEANLQYANLDGATGLLGNEFAQADVTRTKLPDDIKEFKALEIVKETSQNARKIFFAMLLGCVYSWLTIATTTDVRLLTNTASSPLPIIQTEIPIAGFYWAAPLVLMCLYFYFHLYLLKQWEALASLPAIFPDGKRLDERAYPWLLNGLVRRHFRRLKAGRPFIAHIQEWITIFLAWWVVPISMMAFWLRYIPRHDWIGTILHIGLIVLSVAFAIFFYRLCALTLQGKEKTVFRLLNLWKDRRFYYGVGIVVVGILFSLLSYGAIDGFRTTWHETIGELTRGIQKPHFKSLKKIVPAAFIKLGFEVFADFNEQDVSEKPHNYWEIIEKKQLKSVKGANLRGRNLKSASMENAFLVKADLRGAELYGANIVNANLREAMLWEANLQKAIIVGADLTGASLLAANLQGVALMGAKLLKANLTRANLEWATLWYANFRDANLAGTNLQEADFLGANLKNTILNNADLSETNLSEAKNLTIEQLSKVKTLYKAKLDADLMEQVKKCCPHLLEKPQEEKDKTE